jgi:hypothetical protein
VGETDAGTGREPGADFRGEPGAAFWEESGAGSGGETDAP